MAARHEEIAEELRRAIDREEYTVGSLLPHGDGPRGPLRRRARHGPPGRRGPDRRGPHRVTPGRPARGPGRAVAARASPNCAASPSGRGRWGARRRGTWWPRSTVRRRLRTSSASSSRRGRRCCTCCGSGDWTANRCCWSARCTRTGSPRRRGDRARLPVRHPAAPRGHRPGLRVRRARHRRRRGGRPGRRPPRSPPHQSPAARPPGHHHARGPPGGVVRRPLPLGRRELQRPQLDRQQRPGQEDGGVSA